MKHQVSGSNEKLVNLSQGIGGVGGHKYNKSLLVELLNHRVGDPARGYKFFFMLNLSTKFQLLIKTKMLTNKEDSCFKSLRCCIFFLLC